MNNRFKFRVWDNELKRFGNPNVYTLIMGYGLILGKVKHPTLNYYYNPEVVIQQYTGVEDKNGKEMYEGDIVSYRFPNGSILKGVVSFIAGMFVLDFPDQTDSGPIGFLLTLDMEIVGNIFENPELLNV